MAKTPSAVAGDASSCSSNSHFNQAARAERIQTSAFSLLRCGQGGNAVLSEVLSKADGDTYVLSGACAPEAQEKLFKKLLRVTGFPPDRFITLDIRGTDNEGILARLKNKVEEIVRNEEARAAVTPS